MKDDNKEILGNDNSGNVTQASGDGQMPHEESTRNMFSAWKIILPVFIGLGVVALMFYHDAEKENILGILKSIHFDARVIGSIILGFAFMMGRDFGLTWRFRTLTNRQLSWGKAYKVDFLCEFTSCVTPSAVGGSSLGMVFLNSQGIEFGRATTLMMTTLFLDELFFVLACPIVVLLTPDAELFASAGSGFSYGIRLTFWGVYAVLFVWTLVLFMGIIWKPLWMKSVLVRLCRIKFLRRFSDKASQLGDNMIATSKSLKTKPFRFWLEVFGGTALSWISRFMVVNALFFGFVAGSDPKQWLILAREFVIWVVLMVSPTPGGSGLSEWLFSEYYGDMVTSAGMALILAILWRIISYYVYLAIGAVIVPGWIRDTYRRFHPSSSASQS